jgi:transposase
MRRGRPFVDPPEARRPRQDESAGRDGVGEVLHRAGELTPVWAPDDSHEAVRDLVRARAAAVETVRVHKQQVSAFMLKHGRRFPGKKTWGARYIRWLQEPSFDYPVHQIVLQEAVEAVRIAGERVERLEKAIEEEMLRMLRAPW